MPHHAHLPFVWRVDFCRDLLDWRCMDTVWDELCTRAWDAFHRHLGKAEFWTIRALKQSDYCETKVELDGAEVVVTIYDIRAEKPGSEHSDND